MKKFKTLRTRLLIEGGVALAILGGLAGAMVLVAGWLESATKEKQGINREISKDRGEIADIRKQINESDKSSETYNRLIGGRANNDFYIARKEASRVVGELKDVYRLTSLNMNIGPEQKIEDNAFKNITEEPIRASITLNAGGMSDTHLYSFIAGMLESMPGMVKFTNVRFSRQRQVDIQSFRQMSTGGTPELARSDIGFEWYGLRQPPKPEGTRTTP